MGALGARRQAAAAADARRDDPSRVRARCPMLRVFSMKLPSRFINQFFQRLEAGEGMVVGLASACRRWQTATRTVAADCTVPHMPERQQPIHWHRQLVPTVQRNMCRWLSTQVNAAAVHLAWHPPRLHLARRGALHTSHTDPTKLAAQHEPATRCMHACLMRTVRLPTTAARLLARHHCCSPPSATHAIGKRPCPPAALACRPLLASLRHSQAITPLAL